MHVTNSYFMLHTLHTEKTIQENAVIVKARR